MNTRTKRLARAGVIAACVAAIGGVNTYVYAEPSSAALEKKTSELQGELSGLNSQLDSLITQMDDLSQEAEDLNAAMEETQSRLDEAQAEGEEQYEAMKLRIKYIYEAGDSSFIDLLCSAKNMSDFLNKTDFVKNVSEYDRDMLNELLATQEEIEEEGNKLQEQHEELIAKQEELGNKRQEVEQLISSTSGELSNYSAQLERARQAEALAAQEAARQAAEQAASGNQNSGGGSTTVPPAEVTPGDPAGKKSLGSFRITHYCPCFYCCGSWAGGNTASGTRPTPGRTIAVDPGVIPLGTRVIINGQIYVAEDTGSAIKGKKIDIFVGNHSTALAYGVYYAEVYLAD